jgi:two-component system NtrC family sensor kinase
MAPPRHDAVGDDLFRRIVESAPDFISLHAADGRPVYMNPSVERFTGVPFATTAAAWPQRGGPMGAQLALFDAKVAETIATGRPTEVEIAWVPPGPGTDGVLHHVRFFPLLGRDGRVDAVASFGRDVTALRAAERAVARAGTQLRHLFDAIPDLVWVTDEDGRYAACNPAFERLLGVREDQIRGRTSADFFPPEQAAIERERDLEVLAGRAVRVDEEWVAPAAGGPRVRLETIRTRFVDADGNVRVLGVGRDVTQQHAAEELLHKREQQFRGLAENAPDPVSRYDLEGRRIYVNPAFLRMFHDSASALVGHSPEEAPAGNPEVGARMGEAVRGVIADAQPRVVEVSWRNADGSIRTHQVHLVPERDRTGAVATVLAMGRDITALKRSEEELRKLSRVVVQSPASIMITDTDGVIEYVNPKFCEVTGYTAEEVIGKKPSLLKSGETPAEEYEQLWATVRAGKEWRGEFHNKKKSGELYWESASISPIHGADGGISHLLAIKEDITDHKRLEEELRRAQKMEAFGQLAGGVAHDFNNVLTVIQGNAAALNDPSISAVERLALADEILQAADRAARLTRQLLLFSRKKPAQLRPLDLNAVVADTADMLRRLIGEHISLETRFAPGGAPVRADLGMMEQVLMNLVVNARDAMPEGGRVVIETGAVAAADGPRVRLAVRDNGRGIAPEHLPHVFEPFFTTKDVGKGTGLGLATVFGIVQQHGGTIDLESRVGEGTTVEVLLARSDEGAAAPSPREAPMPRAERGSESLLVVEDDASVRALVRRVLEREGYRVLEAASAIAALELWAARRDEIALVLTDMVMPGGMGGREMGARMLAERPDLPIIYSSGYTEDVVGDVSTLRGNARMLDKPYEPGALVRTVRASLDRARAGRGRG